MKDFKSYSQGQSANQTQGQSGTSGQKSASGNADVEQTVNMAAMLAKAFEGKSEAQVLQTIISQAEQGKRDGTLTNTDLDNFYNTLAPLLDGFKRQKLRSIISRLKAI